MNGVCCVDNVCACVYVCMNTCVLCMCVYVHARMYMRMTCDCIFTHADAHMSVHITMGLCTNGLTLTQLQVSQGP